MQVCYSFEDIKLSSVYVNKNTQYQYVNIQISQGSLYSSAI